MLDLKLGSFVRTKKKVRAGWEEINCRIGLLNMPGLKVIKSVKLDFIVGVWIYWD